MTNTLTLQIEPLDTLFFKDGKPFSMGDDSWADGVFPPAPSVIFGALRSWILANNEELKNSVKEIVKDKDHFFNKIEIRNIAYKIGTNLFFPTPLDLVQDKNRRDEEMEYEKDEGEYKLHALKSDNKFKYAVHSENLNTIFKYGNETEKLDVVENFPLGLIDVENSFSNYLSNKKTSYERLLSWKEQKTEEPKIGIGRNDNTKISDAGLLFRIDQIRPGIKENETFKIVVDVFFPNELKKSVFENQEIKLGGEGKIAKVSITENSIKEIIGLDYKLTDKFKIYLSTPALFKKGWLPEFIDKDNLIWENEKYDFEAKLSYAVIGKTKNIGGWDLAKQKPKTMLIAVPEGSIYYFELTKGTLKEVYRFFQENSSISDYYKEQGFGITYLANF